MKTIYAFIFILIYGTLYAQHPEEYKYDKATAKERKTAKVKATWFLSEKYDNASQAFPINGKKDTLGYEFYDHEGRITEKRMKRGGILHYVYYWYDNENRMVRALFCEGDSTNAVYSEYYYDDKNFMIEEVQYVVNDGKIALDYLGKYEYDANGRLVEFTTYVAYVPGLAQKDIVRKYRYDGTRTICCLYDGMKDDTIGLDTTTLTRNGLRRTETAYSRDPATKELVGEWPDIFTEISNGGKGMTTTVKRHTGYNWKKQGYVTWEYDSTITDSKGRVVEWHSVSTSNADHNKYFYPANRNEWYYITYIGDKPITRVSESRTYYQ